MCALLTKHFWLEHWDVSFRVRVLPAPAGGSRFVDTGGGLTLIVSGQGPAASYWLPLCPPSECLAPNCPQSPNDCLGTPGILLLVLWLLPLYLWYSVAVPLTYLSPGLQKRGGQGLWGSRGGCRGGVYDQVPRVAVLRQAHPLLDKGLHPAHTPGRHVRLPPHQLVTVLPFGSEYIPCDHLSKQRWGAWPSASFPGNTSDNLTSPQSPRNWCRDHHQVLPPSRCTHWGVAVGACFRH